MSVQKQVASSQKIEPPFLLKVIRWLYPIVESISPGLATKWGIDLFLTPVPFPFSGDEKKAIAKAEQYNIEIKGKKVCVYSWGEGAVIIFSHGWSGRGTQCWKIMNELVRQGFKVVAFDAPAHGRSDGRKSNLLEFGEAIIYLLEKYKDVYALIGHSLGGVACLYSLTKEYKVEKLITISTPALASDIVDEFVNQINASKRLIKQLYLYVLNKFNVSLNDLSAAKLAESIPHIPVLLIHDKNDHEVKIKNLYTLKEKIEYASTFITEGLSHTRVLRNDAVIQRIVDFLISK